MGWTLHSSSGPHLTRPRLRRNRTGGPPRRPGPSRDSLEHGKCRSNLPGGRGHAAPRQAVRLFARGTGGEARRARLLGARRPANMAGLGDIRVGASRTRRALVLFHQSVAMVLGCSAGCRRERCSCLRPRDRRASTGFTPAIWRPVPDDANRVAARSVAQPLDERGGCRVRGPSATKTPGSLGHSFFFFFFFLSSFRSISSISCLPESVSSQSDSNVDTSCLTMRGSVMITPTSRRSSSSSLRRL